MLQGQHYSLFGLQQGGTGCQPLLCGGRPFDSEHGFSSIHSWPPIDCVSCLTTALHALALLGGVGEQLALKSS